MSGEVASALLAEADPLPYPRRMALFATRARQHAARGRLSELVAELLSGDAYRREVGLFLAVVGGDMVSVQELVQAPEWRLRCRALAAWLRTGQVPVDTVARLLHDAPAQTRAQVYRLLRTGGNADLADALVERVRDRFGYQEAARLLPACSTETVAGLLPELGHAVGNWAALARRHPHVVLDEAGRQLSTLTVPSHVQWWSRYASGVFAAATVAPDRVIELLERFAPPTYLPGDLRDYGRLVDADAQRVLRLLTDPGRARWMQRRLPRALLDRFARMAPVMLVELARCTRDQEQLLAALLQALPPRHREELYDAATADVDRSRTRPDDALLQALPRARRAAEAARILQLDEVRAVESLRLHYTAFLPWARADGALTTATRRAAAEDRAVGYELMLACAGRTGDAAVVTEAVGRLARLRNEQDPVRGRALTALTRVPPGLLQSETAAVLDQVVTDAIQARDSSGMTLDALSRLAVIVLRHHLDLPPLREWALHTLNRLSGNERIPAMARLDLLLRRGQEHDAFAAVRPWIEAGIERGKFQPLFTIARALHKRAWNLPDLQDMLRQATRRSQTSDVARQAISLWLNDPAHRDTRVEQVLLEDPSTATLPQVWQAMCTRRTDLLDLVLTGPPPVGRFLTARARWTPTYAAGLARWLPRQHKSYVDLLARLARDAGTVTRTRTAAIAAAARVPGHGWDAVHRYLDSSNVNLAEAALGALPWTDRPDEALPILLAHADDDRARVATYAASRAARFIPPSQLHTTLARYALARGKVTSRKEALRLLARLAVPGAVAVLHEVWGQDGVHRDVRAAVVAAARLRLDDDRAWQILREAATGSREEILAVLATRAFDTAARHRPGYADLIAAACASPDPEAAYAAWHVFPDWAQWLSDPATGIMTRLTDLDDRTVWRAVIIPIVALVDADLRGSVLAEALTALATVDAADPTREDPQRDRPARRRLDELVQQIIQWARQSSPARDRTALRDGGRALARHDDFAVQAARLLVHASDVTASDLAELCDLLADRPAGAAKVAAELRDRLVQDQRIPEAALLSTAAQLRNRGDLAGGLFAAAIAQCGARYGWSDEWRSLVTQLREHPVPDARTAALDLVMAQE